MRAIFFVLLLVFSTPFSTFAQDNSHAAVPMFKGMELYSWRDDATGTWRYSLLNGTNRNKALTEIKDAKVAVPNVETLKERLANLAEGEQVFWFISPSVAELSFPPEEVVGDLMKFAVEHNVSIEMNQITNSWQEFRNTVYSQEYAEAQNMLRKNHRLISLTNGLGETVLHFLAVENDSGGVDWLYENGADLDSKNKFGTPAIFEVAQLSYKDLFLWFVKNGANVHARDAEGHDIVEYLLEYDNTDMAEWVRQNGINASKEK